jgi:cytidyltransferase-related domain
VQFKLVAMGGTFDIIHIGHLSLIEKAASISEKVIIGLTSDSLATKSGKNLRNNFETRLDNLKKTLTEKFSDSLFEIAMLDDDFGPAVIKGEVDALVVSEETSKKGDILNSKRNDLGLPPVEIIIVPMKLASDGERISSTRIRNAEIDDSGNVIVD